MISGEATHGAFAPWLSFSLISTFIAATSILSDWFLCFCRPKEFGTALQQNIYYQNDVTDLCCFILSYPCKLMQSLTWCTWNTVYLYAFFKKKIGVYCVTSSADRDRLTNPLAILSVCLLAVNWQHNLFRIKFHCFVGFNIISITSTDLCLIYMTNGF